MLLFELAARMSTNCSAVNHHWHTLDMQAALRLELPEHLKSVQQELTAKEQEISKLTSLAEHAMQALLQERARANSAQTQCTQMADEVSCLHISECDASNQ